MPATRRPKPLYQRGEFRLYKGRGGLEVVWYDQRRKRERSSSAGTSDERKGRIALDNLYVETHGGVPVCPECGRARDQSGELVTVLVANYLETKPAGDAVHPRLAHILDFQEATGRVEDRCDVVDSKWAGDFRAWLAGKGDRSRAPGTIENSLIQLAAAFRAGGVAPAFTTIPTIELNRTPQYRADVPTLAAMFKYALEPDLKRDNLLRFLRASVATWGRPDAVYDISTERKRAQWHPRASVLSLNPAGRRQTRKRRATVPIAKQFAPHLNEVSGFYVPVSSVKRAWQSMAKELKLPDEGEAGTKLVRRSMMTLARKRLGEEHWIQGRMMAGHVPVNVSDLYALFDPANLGRALAVTEAIIEEIESLAPGAFYRDFTAQGGNVSPIARAKNA
ncbi:MAG TPA: hypothetical protein VE053_06960 [Allosphingosinicella sp.]|nr:hypothetical protein [Allosphingosinicella sp.]